MAVPFFFYPLTRVEENLKGRSLMKWFALLFSLVVMPMNMVFAEITASRPVNQQPIDQGGQRSYLMDAKGGLWFAYYGGDNFLYVRRPDGSEIKLGAQDRQAARSGLALAAGSDDLSVMWRDKLPEKALYLLPHLAASSAAPEPMVVGGDESEPLVRLEMARESNALYLLWLGEKLDQETKQKFHLYFRYSDDGGKSFSAVERVLPGFYPLWIVDKDFIPVFSWVVNQDRRMIAMRRFDRAGKTFGPMVEIADTPEQITPIYRAFESAGRWFVLWLAQHGDGRDFLLEGAYSADKGQTWKRFAFDTIKGLDLSRLSVAADGKGHIALALSGTRRLRDENPDAKNDLYFAYSSDNGSTWSEPRRFRSPEYQITHAKFPAIRFGAQPGTLIMAWEDWRDIRPNIYVTYSTDYGVTWQPEVPLGMPGRINLAMDYQLDQPLLERDGQYHLLVKQFTNDVLNNADLVDYAFTLADLKQPAALPRGLELEKTRLNEKRLEQRVSQYWEAMQRADYATTYAMMDSFFQSRINRQGYQQKMGTIKYNKFRIDSIERTGKIAKVKITAEAEVPEFKMASGKTYSRPKQEYTFVDTWLFITGDWYREYYEESSKMRYTGY